jgi:hypothetical protein
MGRRHGGHRKHSEKGFPRSSNRVTPEERRIYKGMNIKQRVIIGSMILGFTIINATIVCLSHSLHAYVRVPISFLCSVIFVLGKLTGYFEQRWERDKEMAGIVAERLMGKPKFEAPSDMQYSAGMAQQSANAIVAQQKQASALGGVFGASSAGAQMGLGTPNPSTFPGITK